MNNISIIIDEKSFARMKSGNVTGIIYIKIGDTYFPDSTWSDFPIIILGWWLDILIRYEGHGSSERMSFMDGPCEFDVTANAGEIQAHFYRNDIEKATVDKVDIKAVLKSVILASERSLDYVRQHSWDNEATSELRSVLARAKQLGLQQT